MRKAVDLIHVRGSCVVLYGGTDDKIRAGDLGEVTLQAAGRERPDS